MIIDGKKVAADLREDLKKKVAELKSTYNEVPGLTVILVGEDAPSKIYVRNKEKSATHSTASPTPPPYRPTHYPPSSPSPPQTYPTDSNSSPENPQSHW